MAESIIVNIEIHGRNSTDVKKTAERASHVLRKEFEKMHAELFHMSAKTFAEGRTRVINIAVPTSHVDHVPSILHGEFLANVVPDKKVICSILPTQKSRYTLCRMAGEQDTMWRTEGPTILLGVEEACKMYSAPGF